MNAKIYVANISFTTTEADLRDIFGRFGSVTDVYLAKGRMTGLPLGSAFVTFAREVESQSAVAGMNRVNLNGRCIEVREAMPTGQPHRATPDNGDPDLPSKILSRCTNALLSQRRQ